MPSESLALPRPARLPNRWFKFSRARSGPSAVLPPCRAGGHFGRTCSVARRLCFRVGLAGRADGRAAQAAWPRPVLILLAESVGSEPATGWGECLRSDSEAPSSGAAVSVCAGACAFYLRPTKASMPTAASYGRCKINGLCDYIRYTTAALRQAKPWFKQLPHLRHVLRTGHGHGDHAATQHAEPLSCRLLETGLEYTDPVRHKRARIPGRAVTASGIDWDVDGWLLASV